MVKAIHFLALACALMAVVASAASNVGNRRMLIEGGTWATVNGKRIYVNPSQANATGCTDVSPDDQFTCAQQQTFGACNEEFMLSGNYCARTCKRCGFKVNPSQANATRCTDVAPDERYNCTQQRSFGACSAPFMTRRKYCARTCGFPPCPAVANVTRPAGRPAAGNVTTTPTVVVTTPTNVTLEEEEEAPTLLPVPEVPAAAANETGDEGPEPVVTAVPLANATEPATEPAEEPAAAVVTTPLAPTVITTPPIGAAVAPAAADNATAEAPAEPAAAADNATTVVEPAEPVTGENATVAVEPTRAAPVTPIVVATPPLAAVQEPAAAAANATAPAAAVEPAVGNATAAAARPVAAANATLANATAAAEGAGARR